MTNRRTVELSRWLLLSIACPLLCSYRKKNNAYQFPSCENSLMEKIVYEHVSRPGPGETMAMADDITWLRMPLPFSLNHINLWLLRDESGWVIVDTGVDTNKSREVWHDVFSGPMAGDPATHVIATHLHPDHVGCADWLVHQFDVDLWMTREEYMLCRVLVNDTGREAPEGRKSA